VVIFLDIKQETTRPLLAVSPFWEPPGGRTGPGAGTGHGTGGQGVEGKGARQAQSDARSGGQSLTAQKTQAQQHKSKRALSRTFSIAATPDFSLAGSRDCVGNITSFMFSERRVPEGRELITAVIRPDAASDHAERPREHHEKHSRAPCPFLSAGPQCGSSHAEHRRGIICILCDRVLFLAQ